MQKLTTVIPFFLSLFILLTAPFAFAQENYTKLLTLGLRSYRAGDYGKALEALKKANQLKPDSPDTYFYIGQTYLKIKNPTKAIESFKKCLEKKTDHLEAQVNLGAALIINNEDREAIKYLEQVYQKQPNKENLGYMLGFAYFRLGQYDQAKIYLENAQSSDNNIVNLTNYYLGLLQQMAGQKEKAADLYSRVVTSDPTSPLSSVSQQLLGVIEEDKRQKKKFNLEFTMLGQYDDNLALIPNTNVVAVRDTAKRSFLNLFYLKGEYYLTKQLTYDISASYGLFQTVAYSIRHTDVQDHILSMDFFKRGTICSMPYNFRLNYSYDYLLYGYSYFMQRHTVRPTFFLVESPMNLSIIQYSFQAKEFHDQPYIITTWENRDALNHEVGIVHFIRFKNGKHFFKLGYFFDEDFAQGKDWNYAGNRFVTGFQYTFPKDVILNVDFEYKMYNYLNTNIFFRVKRYDIDRMVSSTMTKEIYKNINLYCQYLHRVNSSNIPLYAYTKNLYSIGFNWRY